MPKLTVEPVMEPFPRGYRIYNNLVHVSEKEYDANEARLLAEWLLRAADELDACQKMQKRIDEGELKP